MQYDCSATTIKLSLQATRPAVILKGRIFPENPATSTAGNRPSFWICKIPSKPFTKSMVKSNYIAQMYLIKHSKPDDWKGLTKDRLVRALSFCSQFKASAIHLKRPMHHLI